MKNTFGQSLTVTVYGESHGSAVGAVIDGISPGIKIDFDYIDKKLAMRRPTGLISTGRVETDEYEFLSGVYNGYTTGTPLNITIKNSNTRSGDYDNLKVVPRPSHADFTANQKYGGYQDYRGGGHFSGRVTAGIVLAGAIISSALEKKGIKIGTHIKTLHGVADAEFSDYEKDIEKLNARHFPALCEEKEDAMKNEILKARENLDSVGGVLESAIIGLPCGLGEPWFDSVESVLSHILFSVPGIKGVEFGSGFQFADMYGSEANDAFIYDGESVRTKTNNNGGINGGITNSMPIIVRCAVKPTPSIAKAQYTLNTSTLKEEKLVIKGRHDPAIIHRARAVVDACLAIAVADLLTMRYGTDYLGR